MPDAAAETEITSDTSRRAVCRVEVRLNSADDPRAAEILRRARAAGVAPSAVRVTRVYLIEGELDPAQTDRLAAELLASPVAETAFAGAEPPAPGAHVIEVHPLPGVMDPPAQTVARAAERLLGVTGLSASTGWRYDFEGISSKDATKLAGAAASPTPSSPPSTPSPTTPRASPPAPPRPSKSPASPSANSRTTSSRNSPAKATSSSTSPRCAPSRITTRPSTASPPTSSSRPSPRPGPSTASTRRSSRGFATPGPQATSSTGRTAPATPPRRAGPSASTTS